VSAEAVGWVFKESPYKGAMFALHLAIADTVNDTYGNELWASVAHLAGKARLGERSVRKGLAEMVVDGNLELLSAQDGHVRRYRFLMPADPCTSCTPAQDAPLHVVPQTPARRAQTPAPRAETPAPRAPISQVTQENPSKEPNALERDLAAAHRRTPPASEFDEFWTVYPLRKAKGAARTAWAKALKKTDAHVIIAAAASYRDDPNRDPRFTKHPATWLNGECWNDEPTERRRAKGVSAAQRWLDRQTGVIDYPEPPEAIER
jgi:hypothetical protein